MKNVLRKAHDLATAYLKWGWPLVLIDAALAAWAGESSAPWRTLLNDAAFAWVLCAPVIPLSLQTVLLVLSLVSVRLVWDPAAPKRARSSSAATRSRRRASPCSRS